MKNFSAIIVDKHGKVKEKKVSGETVKEVVGKLRKSDSGCVIKQVTFMVNNKYPLVAYSRGGKVIKDPNLLQTYAESHKSKKENQNGSKF